MKYSELIRFEPIDSVIQIREANNSTDAQGLVETFVISDRMAERFGDLLIPQLQFDRPTDNKGLLVVGNYGTGKSHLMATVSAIAEHADLCSAVTHPGVARKARAIAGRFEVLRIEIGSTTMTLRDVVCHHLEEKLEELGVDFQFPPTGEVTNHKDLFTAMMAAFEEVYPNQGLLLVVDELLDYLRTRDEPLLILDLIFLRELGEICKSTRFRFIAGVQESLFDSGRFQFAASTLRRVKDRFEQIRIAREDVAYVVSQRLLQKTPEQRGRIREHLAQFAPLYRSMNERMDAFVDLFPVHPAYLDVFEQVRVAEKREVLKTLSLAIRDLVDQEVPAAEPGVVAYDSYWLHLTDNASIRSMPAIREVIDKSQVLEDRIQQGFTQALYKDVAVRIIHALSVHRLTTDDIFAPLGATAEELRDHLCLILPAPEKDAEFLKTLVEKVLQEILRTVNGQFITMNTENQQYYLDIKKDVDFDLLIERRAETLSDAQLDSHYFTALARVMEAADETYVSGYRIWEHELEWRERKAGRSGYLFFGAPNERSTAHPPRDFYLYFLQPHGLTHYTDEKKPDEVFFTLKRRDSDFDKWLARYAGAREQAATASGQNKKIYEHKAEDFLGSLTKWLYGNLSTAFDVTCEGRTRALQAIVRGEISGAQGSESVRDLVNVAGSVCLAPQFKNRSPHYPTFGVLVTRQNREQAASEAIRWITGGVQSKQGAAVLDALRLLDGSQLRPRESSYASHVLDLLDKKKKGQVLNRAELVQGEGGIDYWTRFRLEPEFLAVVLVSLVQSGSVVLSIPGKKLDAGSVREIHRISVRDLAEFKHVEQPKGLPIEALRELFSVLDLAEGTLVSESTRDQAVQDLQREVASRLEKLLAAQANLRVGLSFWGKAILSEQESKEWMDKLSHSKQFLESLQPFNTVGKLNNFPHDRDAVAAQRTGLALVGQVAELAGVITRVSRQTAYLSTAEAVLPREHPWLDEVERTRAGLLAKVTDPDDRARDGFHLELSRTLNGLKTSYIDAYWDLHVKAHLGAQDDKKKAALTKNPQLQQLQKLDALEIMPHYQLQSFQDELFGLVTCFALSLKDLDDSPICPHNPYRPVESPPGPRSASEILADLDDQLDDLVSDWTKTLLNNLNDPTVSDNIALISDPAGKRDLTAFMQDCELPKRISQAFIQALREALTGLEKVAVTSSGLREALIQGGIPCTLDELNSRFEAHVAGLAKGKDPSRVRVVVE